MVTVAALPLTLIAHVPEAPVPFVWGTSNAVRAAEAEVAPVPPDAMGSAVPRVRAAR